MKTAEEILRKSFKENVTGIYGNRISFDMQAGKDKKNFDWIYEAMESYASLVSEEKDRRIRELTEALQSVWRLKDLIGYSDLQVAAHLGESEAIEKMLQQVKQALNPPKP